MINPNTMVFLVGPLPDDGELVNFTTGHFLVELRGQHGKGIRILSIADEHAVTVGSGIGSDQFVTNNLKWKSEFKATGGGGGNDFIPRYVITCSTGLSTDPPEQMVSKDPSDKLVDMMTIQGGFPLRQQ